MLIWYSSVVSLLLDSVNGLWQHYQSQESPVRPFFCTAKSHNSYPPSKDRRNTNYDR
jgi:hypothetical protein